MGLSIRGSCGCTAAEEAGDTFEQNAVPVLLGHAFDEAHSSPS